LHRATLEEHLVRTVVSIGDPVPSGVEHADDTPAERHHLRQAAGSLAELSGRHQLVVTYGSAPHLDLLLRWHHTQRCGPELDVVNAESQAAAGYLLTQELRNELARSRVALLLTQVRVDPNDPAFRHPTRLIGPPMDEKQAGRLANLRRWAFDRQAPGWRLAVPEPEPLAVVEADTIRLLLEAGVVVVCGGGGGIPVVADFEGALRGVGAAVRSELTAAVLARQVEADRLVLLAYRWSVPAEKADLPVTVSAVDARHLKCREDGDRLRLQAACRFVEATGHRAMIGDLSEARAVLDGDAGTSVVAEPSVRVGGRSPPPRP
jgi:carbamate kinase